MLVKIIKIWDPKFKCSDHSLVLEFWTAGVSVHCLAVMCHLLGVAHLHVRSMTLPQLVFLLSWSIAGGRGLDGLLLRQLL